MNTKKAAVKSLKSLGNMFPIFLAILLLTALMNSLLTKELFEKVFQYGAFFDSVIGALFGSISTGSPVNSYILGGEFLKNGVNLTAVTAFIIAWTSVGIIQLPIEGKMLGVKFAVYRNISAFVLAILAAIIINIFV